MIRDLSIRSTLHYSSRWRPLFRLEVARNQACAFVESKIRPSPLNEHQQAVTKADQMHESQIRDRFVPANRRHGSFVPITEALRFTPPDHRKYIACGMAALLHRHRRYSW